MAAWTRFDLSADPIVESLEVSVDGVVASGGWSYVPAGAEASGPAVVFDVGSAPPPGANVEISYTVALTC